VPKSGTVSFCTRQQPNHLVFENESPPERAEPGAPFMTRLHRVMSGLHSAEGKIHRPPATNPKSHRAENLQSVKSEEANQANKGLIFGKPIPPTR
jgi:hypothetical protein